MILLIAKPVSHTISNEVHSTATKLTCGCQLCAVSHSQERKERERERERREGRGARARMPERVFGEIGDCVCGEE